MIRKVQVALLVCFLSGFVCSSSLISRADSNLLANKVKELTERSLKYKEMQDYMETLNFSRYDLQGVELLDTMSNALRKKFQRLTKALRNLEKAVQESFSGLTSDEYQCCQIPLGKLEYNPKFRRNVSTSQVCELISSNAPSSSTRLQSGFSRACMDNLASVPSMKWQYFGSEQGVTTQFPATKVTNCGNYDNRFRSWYVQAIAPKPKQVVIVLDKSGSMNQRFGRITFMEHARRATKTVIDTLNSYDEFALVAFSTNAALFTDNRIPNGTCFKSTFAQATPQNKKRVKEHIDTIYAIGGTNYLVALNAAFDFFEFGKSIKKADKVILFMSDGQPNNAVQDIYNTITTRNANNSVLILTYGLGNSFDPTILYNMARMTEAEVGPEHKKGIFTGIRTPSNLRNQMGSYYNFYSVEGQGFAEPVWTVPYLDGWGQGTLITAALPVYTNRLVGVAAVDIGIEEMLSESIFFRPTELSYSFVINQKGLLIAHPLFSTVITSEPLFVDVTAFESDPQFLSVYASMKRGESGSKTFMSTRILPQGDSTNYPVRKVRVQSTYYWKQIPGTEFSLCLVLADNDQQVLLQNLGSLPSDSFLYHRLDLVHPKQLCFHGKTLCSKNRSSVALAARAFKDPEQYISVPETVNNVRQITSYFEGKTTKTVLKVGVKNEVVATLKAEELWKKVEHNDLTENVFWRYIATKKGVMRIFPGTQLPSNFDPTMRSWYETTQANRDKYVMTPPYRDALSGLSVMSFCRALLEGSCLVIDHSGFVIASPSFLKAPETAFNRHIAAEDKNLAAALFAANILKPAQCSNIEKGFIQKTFTISANQSSFSGRTFYPDCFHFEVKPVKGTNALLIMVDKTSKLCSNFMTPDCYCRHNSFIPTCPTNHFTCSCPCTKYNKAFNPCENQYRINGLTPPPCPPPKQILNKIKPLTVDLNTLERCYNVSF